MKSILSLSVFVMLSMLYGCATFGPGTRESSPAGQPFAEREFRAVWVATVGNTDWPTEPGLSTDEQQRQARAILDTAVSIGLNAIVFQVRPHCDALYQSSLEPWSYYLTGEQGKRPDPYYDPLQFWIEEAHARGLELHAWFNPYRAHLRRGGPVTDSSMIRKKPHLVRQLPGETYWMDPGHAETKKHSLDVVMDVVRRYDVDGIHFDDYFYPYGDGNFPDDETWNAYVNAGGSLSRDDWRRANVNEFIKNVYEGIKREKPHVKFGLSPFGIWRPSNPPSISGFDQYGRLYADARLWLNKGWVDYWTPQLYWPVNQIPQSYPVLLGWWARENTENRNLWPGLYTGRIGRGEGGLDELVNEIMIARGFVPEGPGHVHFSMRAFLRDSTVLNDGLRNGPYRKAALVPASPWLDNTAPMSPTITESSDTSTVHLSWSHVNTADVFRWVVYARYGNDWDYSILNRDGRLADVPRSRTITERVRSRQNPDSVSVRVEYLSRIAVSAVDRMGNESAKIFRDIMPSEPVTEQRQGGNE